MSASRSEPPFQAVNPDFEKTVQASFARQGLMESWGARLVSIMPGQVAISLPFDRGLTQQAGAFHGAALAAIGDSAGGYAALSLMPSHSEVVTVEYKINFIRPAHGNESVATGTVLRAGRSIVVCQIDVKALTDRGETTTAAIMQATFMRVPA